MNERPAKRTLTAIIVADVVGYSRHMGADEAATLRRLTSWRNEIIDPTVAAFRGRIVNAVGDSLLLEFDSVVEATLAAITVQQKLAERNLTLEDAKRLEFRMGVNIGDVIIQGGAIFGDGVNVAARLQALAEPGGICISSGAYEQVRGKIEAPFIDMGVHQVKNITRNVAVLGLPSAALQGMDRPKPPGARRSNWWTLYAGASILLILAVGVLGYRTLERSRIASLASGLDAVLAATQAKTSNKIRAKTISDYLAIAPHRALAIAPKTQAHWWTGDWPSADTAIEKVLERCQLAFNESCQIVAVDEELMDQQGTSATLPRDMPRMLYSGAFDPAEIPGLRQIARDRNDVVNYAKAPEPKAAAIHPRGLITIVTGAASQRRAEIQALKLCNDDDSAKDSEGPCFLYAQGNQVVLPQHRTTPISQP